MMEQYQYESYDKYLRRQIKGYKEKKDRVWAKKKNIKHICKTFPFLEKGICHGVRTGKEVEWFRRYLRSKHVIGTEIGDAVQKYIVKWDFNEPRYSWLKAFDFVYTNSFDHAYSPEDTMRVWSDQLKPGGLMIIETSSKHEKATKLDPLGITEEELEAMMRKYFAEVDCTDLPFKRKNCTYSKICIGRKS